MSTPHPANRRVSKFSLPLWRARKFSSPAQRSAQHARFSQTQRTPLRWVRGTLREGLRQPALGPIVTTGRAPVRAALTIRRGARLRLPRCVNRGRGAEGDAVALPTTSYRAIIFSNLKGRRIRTWRRLHPCPSILQNGSHRPKNLPLSHGSPFTRGPSRFSSC
jgi:hypothetical protein